MKTILFLSLIAISILLLKNKILRTTLALMLFFFIGVISIYFNDDRNYDSFYKHHFKESSTIVLKIDKVLKPGEFYRKYYAKIINVDKKITRGTVLLNVKKDSTSTFFNVDDQLLLNTSLKEINPPLNPHQFNYKLYLVKQGVYHQLFTDKNQYLKTNKSTVTLVGLSARFRSKIEEAIKKYHFKENELSVINALLLGQRQDISKELIRDYQRAGAVHILAISGLHIGIILIILNFLFKPIERLKQGKTIKVIIILILLWMFAFIAGLSASVVRAVTMFMFVAIGMSYKKKKITVFSVITSMLLLLLFKPLFLFDVGFQLSYLAVLGILSIQPQLYKAYKPRFFLDRKAWELFSVSVAAQIAVLPLSIYYFQQFPGLFLVSNLVIIPFLGAILIGGFLVIILSLLNILPQLIADFYGLIISVMNSFISWVSHQEQFLFKEISISFLLMLIWYVSIVFGISFFKEKSYKKLVYFLVSIFLLQGVYLFENSNKKHKKELIVFHKNKHSVIGKRLGDNFFLECNLDSLQLIKDNSINSYKVSEGVHKIEKISFKNYTNFANKDILLVDSLGVYNVATKKKPIVVLQFSPKINLTRLIKTIKPSQIIADGSSYKSYVSFWEETCKELQIPFYYTGKNGAYVLKY
ncbi:ComEC/Rec2 family competence protein [Polaribacter sargassicola]|uniref:ComEC/Rec2 family competence protein n=1 Tax=Polaribacter sargassicola TaxID=2836891 RepID=UPI001F1F96EF|nr:ComEC/Rec2 family competence protein [Polaribacter sp. DS7-9]